MADARDLCRSVDQCDLVREFTNFRTPDLVEIALGGLPRTKTAGDSVSFYTWRNTRWHRL